MTDAIPQHITLRAIDPTRNIHRAYSIIVSADLFGQIIVDTHWGRIGSRGQTRRVSFDDRARAGRYVAAILARRRSAVKRIGVGYRRIVIVPV